MAIEMIANRQTIPERLVFKTSMLAKSYSSKTVQIKIQQIALHRRSFNQNITIRMCEHIS